MLHLTSEQIKILNYDLQVGESLFVNAYAGTGKTTTLIEFIKRHPKQKFLYLCFNNKGYQEASKRFKEERLHNATASTIHGLARDLKAAITTAGKFSTRIHLKTIQDKLSCSLPTAWWVANTLKHFCESADDVITEANVPYCGGNQNIKKAIQEQTNKIWAAMLDMSDPFPVSFDGYLKMYQLMKPKLMFHYILIDECQDSNPVTLMIALEQLRSRRLILIGDESQKIYSWRSAVNAFQELKPTFTSELTESFRFGPNIAKLATLLLTHFQGRTTPLKGFQTTDSIGFIPEHARYTFIARTNASLYEKAIEASKTGKKIHFIGTSEASNWDPSTYYKFNDARDVYALMCDKKGEIKNPFFRNFTNYEEFQAVATGKMEGENQAGDQIQGDKEMAALARLVDKYKEKLPETLQQIICACTSEECAHIVLGTAHRAKGMEWDIVKLADDFIDLVIEEEEEVTNAETGEKTLEIRKRLSQPDLDEPTDEYNLLYVASTRAKKHLEPCTQIKKFYTATELHKNPKFWDVKESDHLPKANNAPPPPPVRKEVKGIILNVPFSDKEVAKSIAKRYPPGKLIWHDNIKKWSWEGTPLPLALKQYEP